MVSVTLLMWLGASTCTYVAEVTHPVEPTPSKSTIPVDPLTLCAMAGAAVALLLGPPLGWLSLSLRKPRRRSQP